MSTIAKKHLSLVWSQNAPTASPDGNRSSDIELTCNAWSSMMVQRLERCGMPAGMSTHVAELARQSMREGILIGLAMHERPPAPIKLYVLPGGKAQPDA